MPRFVLIPIAITVAIIALLASKAPDIAYASDGVSDVATGNSHVCAVKEGAIWCWGSNRWGNNGDDDWIDWPEPRRMPGLGTGAEMVDTLGDFTCAVVDGAAVCWGINNWDQLGRPLSADSWSEQPVVVEGLDSGVESVATGIYRACAVVSGAAKCWGNGAAGALGDGVNHGSDGNGSVTVATPVTVEGLPSNSVVNRISTGGVGGTTCVVVDDSVRCWGSDMRDLLGNGANGSSLVPITPTGLESGVTDISVGTERACAIKMGSAYCWGDRRDDFGYHDVPTLIPELGTSLSRIWVERASDCAIGGGQLRCYGSGALGNGALTTDPVATVVPTGFDSATTDASPGDALICATNGDLYCWGRNDWSDGVAWAENLTLSPQHIVFDETAPSATVSGPELVSTTDPYAFSFEADEDAEFFCSFHGDTAYFPCASPRLFSFNTSMNGAQVLTVKPIDMAGNEGQLAEHQFVVDIPEPVDPPNQPPVFDPGSPMSPGPPVAQPVSVRASVRAKALRRSRPLELTVNVRLSGASGTALGSTSCAHRTTVSVAAARANVRKTVVMKSDGNVCVGTLKIKLPKKSRRSNAVVRADFRGNSATAAYLAKSTVRIR